MIIRGYFGEFGLKVRYWVPQLHYIAQTRQDPTHVEIELGEEALFPGLRHLVRSRPLDDTRKARPRDLGVPERRFVPEPYVKQGVECDIVICPRRRMYGATKNWPHWAALAELPNVFAAGAPDSSYRVACPAAWDYDRYLDASIEALRDAKLCIATDAGLAHLALLCGTPLLLITYHGRPGPGPVVDEQGRELLKEYPLVKWDEYYSKPNHTGSPVVHADNQWDDPEWITDFAIDVASRPRWKRDDT